MQKKGITALRKKVILYKSGKIPFLRRDVDRKTMKGEFR